MHSDGHNKILKGKILVSEFFGAQALFPENVFLRIYFLFLADFPENAYVFSSNFFSHFSPNQGLKVLRRDSRIPEASNSRKILTSSSKQ